MSATPVTRPESPLLSLAAPAKVNRYLRILGKRADGFHELETIFQTLAVADRLDFFPSETKSKSETKGKSSEDHLSCSDPSLPCNDDNLVCRAVQRWRQAGGQAPSLHIYLDKKLPAGGGLGGGSSDAAAALRGLQQLASKALDDQALHELACELGSDVPFFLYGGRAYARGRGERLTPLSDGPSEPITLLITNIHCSTPKVFSNLSDAERQTRDPLSREQCEQTAPFNGLQAAALRAFPAMQDAEVWARGHHGMLCGSGGTWFARGHVSGPSEHPEWLTIHTWTRAAQDLDALAVNVANNSV